MKRNPAALVLVALLMAGTGVFVAGIGWGLPSHRIDPYLFGEHPVWSGNEIIARGGGYPAENESRTVNVSSTAIHATTPTVVNATDEQRARIVRRFRLQSYNVDEMLTLYALASMRPARHDFDPRLYSYGGLWVYPTGALLKLAQVAGFLHLTPDMAWYLDRPEEFGRFYVVARLYSVLWGLIGIVVVYLLVRRIGGSVAAGAVGGLCFLLMPVVITAAHEAKPHLGGAVLMLLTVLVAGYYCESGTLGAWLTAAILAGLALGMVVTSLSVLAVLVAMVFVRKWLRREAGMLPFLFRAAGALLVAVCVYFITNPYVGINLIRNRAILRSDFGRAHDAFSLSLKGVPNALLITGLGTSFVLAAAGVVGIAFLIVQIWISVRRAGADSIRKFATQILLGLLALLMAVQFTLFADRYNPDNARYGLAFDICLAVAASVLVESLLPSRGSRALAFGLLVLTTGWMGSFYVRGFLRDSSDRSTRMEAASKVQELLNHGNTVIAVLGDPIPLHTPPVDLWRSTLIMYPKPQLNTEMLPAGVNIAIHDNGDPKGPRVCKLICSTPISFASKNFYIQTEQGAPEQ